MNRFLATAAIALALCAPVTAHAADYGVGDLRRMHSEYDANEARWANTFTGRTFEGVMPLGQVNQEVFGGGYYATFFEDPTDWMPGVYCDKLPTSRFLIQRNKGELIEIRGVIDRHAFGAVHLTNCALSLAPNPAEIESAKARRAEAEARAQHDAADAEAKAKAKAAAEAEAQAKAEGDRPRIEAEAKAKIEAERAQIEADAKAKIRAQIEADLRAKAEAEAKAKAEADAKDDIEAAKRAKDEAAAQFKAAEEARMEAEAVARNEDNARAAKMAHEASVRADKEAAATKATEEARLEAEAKARHEDNVRAAKAREEAAARAEVESSNRVRAEAEQRSDSGLAMLCNNLPSALRARQNDLANHRDDAVASWDLSIKQSQIYCDVLREHGKRYLVRGG